MTNSQDNTNGGIVHMNSSSEELRELFITWVTVRTHYTRVKDFLEHVYRSPADMHESHANAIEYIDGILRDLKVIEQASNRLREKERTVEDILKAINTSHEGFTIEQHEELDSLIKAYSKGERSTYEDISKSVEFMSAYFMDKIYLSFHDEVESKMKVQSQPTHFSMDMSALFPTPKSFDTPEAFPKELCSDIYSHYINSRELPIPALQVFIYIEGQPFYESKMFGPPNTNESNVINSWRYSKSPYRVWISSLCGRVLAYYTLMGRDEMVRGVLSRIKPS